MLSLLWLYCKAQNLKATEKSDFPRYLMKNLRKRSFAWEKASFFSTGSRLRAARWQNAGWFFLPQQRSENGTPASP